MTDAARLHGRADALAARIPPLLIEAESLAQTVILGEHGRRRPGHGTEFWQYRQAMPGDPARLIDWRRSARSDTAFVQDKEWHAAQTVMIRVDPSASMRFTSSAGVPSKAERARLLALALAVLLAHAGERVGLLDADHPPRRGTAHLAAMAARLMDETAHEHDTPDAADLPVSSRAVLMSDFLGDLASVEATITEATKRGVRGALVQVLDPAEEGFPFDGRTIFESMGGGIRHETLDAGELRARYLARLAERKDRLALLARQAGWQMTVHHTDTPATSALLWLHGALSRRRGIG